MKKKKKTKFRWYFPIPISQFFMPFNVMNENINFSLEKFQRAKREEAGSNTQKNSEQDIEHEGQGIKTHEWCNNNGDNDRVTAMSESRNK